VFYIAHRLFAAHDRALAASLADRLADKVGTDRVFLPFCDTDEEDLVAEVKGQRLFELDGERLRRLDVLIAILHGPGLDDGVCMEIGYAWAVGAPVILVTTDFQTYSLTENGPHLDFPDPLLHAVATRIVRLPLLSAAQTVGRRTDSRFAAFRDRNTDQVSAMLDATVEAVIAASAADRVLVDVSGPETPPGAAILIGAARASGIPVAAYAPRAVFTHAAGREPNWRNLMIQYAVDTRLDSIDAVTEWLTR
jgi:nucleoside 2-deoxyribosyltransferase